MVERDKSNNITGIPSPYGFAQSEIAGAEPNREENDAVIADDDAENYAVDYFDAEEHRLESLASPTISPDETWSEGLNDEANEGAEAEWAGKAFKDSEATTNDVGWASVEESRRDMDQLEFYDIPPAEGPPMQI